MTNPLATPHDQRPPQGGLSVSGTYRNGYPGMTAREREMSTINNLGHTNIPPFPDSPPAFQWIPTRALEEELASRNARSARPLTAEQLQKTLMAKRMHKGFGR